jgi:DNA-binding LacI/PurR family transcriptional regulator
MVDQERLLEEAAARLAARGRRRVAWVPSGRADPDWLRPTLDALEARHGITSPGRWVHPLDQLQPKWVRHALEALMAPAPRARPDGLVVLDDHLIGPIGAALAELGIAVPEDLLVVGYWNFPLPYAGELPVLRLGQDVVEQLRTVLRLLREDQAGPAPPRHVPLAPVDAVEAPRRHDAPARA